MNFEQWEQAEKASAGSKQTVTGNRSTWFQPGLTADYALRCAGHSMIPTFFPGELVFIHRQGTFSDGQLCQVMIDGKHTLKRVYRLSDGFRLVPDNKQFQPVEITGKEAEKVQIAGVAVARSPFRE